MSGVVIHGLDVLLAHDEHDSFIVLHHAISPADAEQTAGIFRENLDRYAEENRGAAAFEAAAAECDAYATDRQTRGDAAHASGWHVTASQFRAQQRAAEDLAERIRALVGATVLT